MTAPTIHVHVSTRAAILAGKSRIGIQSLEITDEALTKLTPEQRLEIALLLEGDTELGMLPSDPPIIEPTMEAIIPALASRAAGRKEIVEARLAAEARAAEEAAVLARETAAKEGMRRKSLREWVTKHGDEEMQARMAEGFVQENEILDAVMDELFEFDYPQYEPLRRGDACECACAGHVEFIVGAPKYMDSAQFARLTTMRDNAPEGATVEPVEHKAKCPACKCVPIARLAGRVHLPWGGWILARDFSLG